MTLSTSPPTRRSGADDTLIAIDAALAADVVMCFCGCGQMVDETRPSPYFYSQRCSEFWHLSQHHPDPEAWRAEARASDGVSLAVEFAHLSDMPRPNPEPREGDTETAMDRLEPRPSRSTPPPDSFIARARAVIQRAIHRPPPLSEFERSVLAEQLRTAVTDGNYLAALAEQQARENVSLDQLRRNTWSVTYVSGGEFDDPTAGTVWRVDVGNLSDHVYVPPGHGGHQRIVMECVERLRQQQNGRLE